MKVKNINMIPNNNINNIESAPMYITNQNNINNQINNIQNHNIPLNNNILNKHIPINEQMQNIEEQNQKRQKMKMKS